MVQVFGPTRTSLMKEMIGQSLGKGLADFTNDYFTNKDLEGVLNNPEMDKLPFSEKASRLESAMRPHGERGQKLLQSRLGIEQNRLQEQQQNVLSKFISGKELKPQEEAILPPEVQLKLNQQKATKKIAGSIYQSVLDAGYPPETAKLWQQQMEAAPVGGQTDVIKQVNELIRRSPKGKGMGQERPKEKLTSSIEIPGIDNKSYDLDFAEAPESEFRTHPELVKEQAEHKKINTPIYETTIDKLNALDEDFEAIRQMQEYNETPGALPVGKQKWNVNWDTGDLRVAALATPETQGYVKLIARMLNKAKDFYPGRVTNFDLETFKKGFPTLANSPEGRTLIAKQMSLANRVAYLKEETLKAAVDHYGTGTDPHLIRKEAQKNYSRLKKELESELKDVGNQVERALKEKQANPESEQTGKMSLEEIFG